ncbi:MAG: helix-turn-helix domain-containing protein [Oscillospiraceae bacterium]|nr:helix-turn-helix domain-containing protein [Oscillospiraceae bacterium]MCD7792156.1 helix-turn-helix domain-containing protein [Oscillospiraceae bacterium]MCD8065781.1 helix-turn-helix domain-containing protein [Oscillospiraceae bacterium]MCD8191196.1 helix-turn-helix domain-containing protein [Oscillospiraceae bacterium]MCD8374831.1 helix-turn-helix domain-containing protein [Oscillospiraceae bacterium]
MIDIKVMGENIRRERKRQLLTIEQLAERAGISDNFLGKIERGEGMPSLPTIDSIACALNVGIDFLKSGAEQGSEYKFISSVMDINAMTDDQRDRFIDFISTNVRFFKNPTEGADTQR